MIHTGAVKIYLREAHHMPNSKSKRIRNKNIPKVEENKKISIGSAIYLWLKIIIMKLIPF